jgi:hypothetical protein
MVGARDQPVAFQFLQRLRQHLGGDALDLAAQFVEADRTVSKLPQDQRRPFVGDVVEQQPGRAVLGIDVVVAHGRFPGGNQLHPAVQHITEKCLLSSC